MATTSLPAVNRQNADHWNSICSCQYKNFYQINSQNILKKNIVEFVAQNEINSLALQIGKRVQFESQGISLH